MAQPTRRDLAAEEARSRILAAAADCVVRDGLAEVRMAGIARAAGVSSGLVHYHFATKEQLFAEVLAFSTARSAALTRQALLKAGDEPAQRLSTFLDHCLPSSRRLTHEWLLWQELDLLCLRRPELARVSSDLYETLYRPVAEMVAAGVAQGVFDVPPDDVRPVAEAAVALCDGLGARVLARDDLTVEQARDRMRLAVGRLVGHPGPLPHPSGRRAHPTELQGAPS